MNIRGFITLEMLIALAVLALGLSAAAAFVFSAQAALLSGQNDAQAQSLARSMLESARASAAEDFNLVNPLATTTNGIYKQSLGVQMPDIYTKQVSANLTWQSGGQNLTQSFSTLISNWQNAQTASDCASVLSGDWQHPRISSLDFAQAVGDPSGSYAVTGLYAYQKKLYATASNSASNKETFFIFDVSNPQAPSLIGKLDNDPADDTGLNGIFVAGKYAYVASASSFTKGQLQIVDVSQTPPKVITTYKIPSSIVAGSSSQGIGRSVFYQGGYVYLGLAKTVSGPEFNIIDVSNVLAPLWKGGLAVGNAVNDIYVRGSAAYIASPNADDVLAVDVSPGNLSANMQPFGDFNASGGLHGKSLAMVGQTLYLGRTFGNNEFYILNVAAASSISELGHLDLGSGNNTTVDGLAARDYLAFLLTDNQLQILRVDNPLSISNYAPALSLPAGNTGTALACEGNYLLAASVSAVGKSSLSIISAGP